jgi:hypothetical protein
MWLPLFSHFTSLWLFLYFSCVAQRAPSTSHTLLTKNYENILEVFVVGLLVDNDIHDGSRILRNCTRASGRPHYIVIIWL